MKVFKYWVSEKATVPVGKDEQEIKVYGGSDFSLDDARQNALAKVERIKKRISGVKEAFEDYEADIREEILEKLSNDAVVTRNRYGARVLNVKDLMILDIDHPPLSLWSFFKYWGQLKKGGLQGPILEQLRKTVQKKAYADLGFRVYETKRGIRVIVSGREFEARSEEAQRMMRDFHCDWLYVMMCKKQNCFRARLTPKPYRIRMKAIRVPCPMTPEQAAGVKAWAAEYEAKSEKYAVCKFIEQLGRPAFEDTVIKYHDEVTRAHKNLKLA